MAILDHMCESYPRLASCFNRVGQLDSIAPRLVRVDEAMTKIIVGQMLSRAAAETIFARLENARIDEGKRAIWALSDAKLRRLGLSARKARAIREFGAAYSKKSKEIERWRQLDYDHLVSEASRYWGISNWSIDMLAIFYFGMPDVFPSSDGTIKKAQSIIASNYLRGEALDPGLATPYRTTLALYIWAFVDRKIIGHIDPPSPKNASAI